MQTSRKNTLYEQDYDLWLGETIKLLRNGDFDNIDIDNLIAELDNMGGSNKDALENNLIVILAHLLKWKYQLLLIRSQGDNIYALIIWRLIKYT